MIRPLLTAAAILLATSTVHAHFPFLVPDGADRGKAVFSDSLKPDTAGVPVDRIANTKLVVIQGGKGSPVNWTLEKTANCYTFEAPGSGSRVVLGTTDYGVVQRGESKPFLLKYYAKAVFGGLPSTPVGDAAPLELVPVIEGGKLRFKILAAGKPLAGAEVTVLVPGEAKSKIVASDEAGLTPAFEQAGLFGAQVRLVEAKAGEQGGKKFEETRHYATVVVDNGKK